MPPVFLVAAVEETGGMGYQGGFPWNLPGELRYFAQLTTTVRTQTNCNRVIMGRKTWESIPADKRPLRKRDNVVLSHNPDLKIEGARVLNSLENALILPTIDPLGNPIETVFVIGGSGPMEEMLENPILSSRLTGIYLTCIHKHYVCDVFFPPIPKGRYHQEILKEEREAEVKLTFWRYLRTPLIP